MVHRIFIAIRLPEDTKEELVSLQEKWLDLPCRWTTKENLHITLVFLGNTSDNELQEISRILHDIAPRHSPFSVEFSRISYGPSAKDPRMIWVEDNPSAELLHLQKALEKELAGSHVLHFVPEKRPWTVHLTLGRLNAEFTRIELEERPEINEEISLSFAVDSIEIMESRLKQGAVKYSIIESIKL